MANSNALRKPRPENGLNVAHKNEEKAKWKTWQAGLDNYVFGRTQPQDIDLEQAVLGAVLIDKDAIRKVQAVLSPETFYLEAHQIVYQACVSLQDTGSPIDILTVTNWLRTNHFIEKIGNAYYLVELTNRVASAANIEYHARILAQKALSREAIELFTKGIKALYEEADDVFNVRNDISEKLRSVSFTSYLRSREASQVITDAAMQPDMLQLAGALLRHNEISILFAPPGVGKSIFAVQIADAISYGKPVFPEGILPNESDPLRVGFFDFELMDKEFATRYTDAINPLFSHDFSPNFIRVDCNPEFTDLPEGEAFDRYILREIENVVVAQKLRVIIVDNITAIASAATSDATVAIAIMNTLKKLRLKYDLTILVLAHTTKMYNKTLPLEMANMGGASQIQNFANTIFAIGQDANDKNCLYIKQLKGRNGCLYDAENIIRVERSKNQNFLAFRYLGQGREQDMLASLLESGTQDMLIVQAIEHRRKTGDGWRETAKSIGWAWSHVTLMSKCKEYEKGGQKSHELNPAEADRMPAPRQEPTEPTPF